MMCNGCPRLAAAVLCLAACCLAPACARNDSPVPAARDAARTSNRPVGEHAPPEKGKRDRAATSAAEPVAGGYVAQASAEQVLHDEGEPEEPGARTDAMDTKLAVAASTAEPAAWDESRAEHVERRKPLFQGWPEPAVALVLTGRQYGYVEPCGCAGLENQKGGLVRRHTLLQQLRGKGWHVVPVDAGNQIRRFGRQPEIKFQITCEGLATMGYRAIAFGPDDLRLPAPELVAVIAPEGSEASRFVAANVTVLDPSFTSQFLVIEEGGKKIGLTSVLGARNAKMVTSEDVTLEDASTALQRVWPKLRQQSCDLYVLVAHASIDESIALAKQYPQFPLVVTTGGAGEPTLQPERIPGTSSQLIQVGTKGMFAGVVGLFDDPQKPLRYQRVALDDRFADTPAMLQLLGAYQEQLKNAGLEGLEVRAQPHPSGRQFVGSESCLDCHEKEYNIWKEGRDGHAAKHSHAYATLQHPPQRSNIPRNFDPECLSCHVVGWNPQKYYPYKSGYLSLNKTPNLTDVGCENCHGPGSAHVEAENGDVELEEEAMEKLREEVSLKLEVAEQKCRTCHDLDNSPDFQEKGAFDRYWQKIKH